MNLLPIEYSSRLKLDHELVWNALYLFWLLEDYERHKILLQLDHQASSQTERLSDALQARNLRLVGTGQEEWNHACDSCCWLKENVEGGV